MWWGPWRVLGPHSGKVNECTDILIRRWEELGRMRFSVFGCKRWDDLWLRKEINWAQNSFLIQNIRFAQGKIEEGSINRQCAELQCSPTLPLFVWSEQHAAELLSAQDRELHTYTHWLREAVVPTSCLWLLVFTMSIRHLLHVIQNTHTHTVEKTCTKKRKIHSY